VCNQKKTKISLPLKIANIKKSELSLVHKNLDQNLVDMLPVATTKNCTSQLSDTQKMLNMRDYMESDVGI